MALPVREVRAPDIEKALEQIRKVVDSGLQGAWSPAAMALVLSYVNQLEGKIARLKENERTLLDEVSRLRSEWTR